MSSALKGLLLALAAAAFFTSGDVVVKTSAALLSVWQVVAGRSVVGVVLMPLIAKWRGKSLTSDHKAVLLTAALGGLSTFACLTYAIRMVPLAEALILLYTFPAFSAAMSPWLAGERSSAKDWLLIGLAFGGICLILLPEQGRMGLDWGHLLALAAGFSYGLAITLTRRVSAKHSALAPYFYNCLVGLAVGAAVLFFLPGPVLPQSPLAWLAVAGVGLFGAGAQVSANKAVQFLSGPKVGVVLMAELILGALVGALFFSEAITWRMAAGSVLVLVCGAWLSLKRTPV